MKLRARWASVAALAVIAGGLAVTNATGASAATTVGLSGTISCTNGQAVMGVWVDSASGGSRWADWKAFPGRPADALYWTGLTFNSAGSWTRLHVGCGGPNTSNWRSTVITPYVWVKPIPTFTVNAVCNAANPGRFVGGCSFPPKGRTTTNPDDLGIAGYCTWGAYRKWNEALGYFPYIRGNAAEMDEKAGQSGWRVTDVPSRRSMIVINSAAPRPPLAPYGHVAWVDNVRWDGANFLIDITEMNGGKITNAKEGITTLFGRYSTRTLTWSTAKVGDWKFIQAWN